MKRLCAFAFAFPAAFLALPLPAFADKGEKTPLNLGDDPTAEAAASGGGGGGSLFRTLLGLAIVIGVIYAVAWVLKQIKQSKEGKASGLGLQTVATLPVGNGRTLHLVRTGRDLVLLGVGEHGVTPIRTYTEEEALDRGLIVETDDQDPDPPSGGLIDQLRQRTVIR
jgi:flagellar protein FliO/FliZ